MGADLHKVRTNCQEKYEREAGGKERTLKNAKKMPSCILSIRDYGLFGIHYLVFTQSCQIHRIRKVQNCTFFSMAPEVEFLGVENLSESV